MSCRFISEGAEITPEDIGDAWLRGRAELFADMVDLANDWGIDVYNFLEEVYARSGLKKCIEYETITLKKGQMRLLEGKK